jgi:hypothetical protein
MGLAVAVSGVEVAGAAQSSQQFQVVMALGSLEILAACSDILPPRRSTPPLCLSRQDKPPESLLKTGEGGIMESCQLAQGSIAMAGPWRSTQDAPQPNQRLAKNIIPN